MRQPPSAAERQSLPPGIDIAPFHLSSRLTEVNSPRPAVFPGSIPPGDLRMRERIVAAVIDLAHQTYDEFRIRDVAERAGISPSTLYRYFPSKNDLLVTCLQYWLTHTVAQAQADLAAIGRPLARLRHLTGRMTHGLRQRPLLADAFVRAYLVAHSSGADSDVVRDGLSRAFAQALSPVQDVRRCEVSDLLTDVWTAKVPALVQNRLSIGDLQRHMERVTHTIRWAKGNTDSA